MHCRLLQSPLINFPPRTRRTALVSMLGLFVAMSAVTVSADGCQDTTLGAQVAGRIYAQDVQVTAQTPQSQIGHHRQDFIVIHAVVAGADAGWLQLDQQTLPTGQSVQEWAAWGASTPLKPAFSWTPWSTTILQTIADLTPGSDDLTALAGTQVYAGYTIDGGPLQCANVYTVADIFAPITSVPAPTYTDPMLIQAFSQFNAARAAYGVPELAQDKALDQAAANHSSYLSLNNLTGHTEVSGLPGFTGATAAARISAALGSNWSVGEGVTGVYEPLGSDMSAPATVLLSAPYHRFGALSQIMTKVGLGLVTAPNGGVSAGHLVADYSGPKLMDQGGQDPSWIGIWPTAGATNVPFGWGFEDPNPVPELGATCAGTAASLELPYGQTLNVGSFTMVDANGNPLNVKVLTAATDPNNLLKPSQAVAIPLATLKVNATYTVAFSGSQTLANGTTKPLNRTWTFTTGTSSGGCTPTPGN